MPGPIDFITRLHVILCSHIAPSFEFNNRPNSNIIILPKCDFFSTMNVSTYECSLHVYFIKRQIDQMASNRNHKKSESLLTHPYLMLLCQLGTQLNRMSLQQLFVLHVLVVYELQQACTYPRWTQKDTKVALHERRYLNCF